jgi:hypothetical protein
MKIFQVVNMPDNPDFEPNWSTSEQIEAYDLEHAVEVWAEQVDSYGDYLIIGNYGCTGPVYVRELGTTTQESFSIEAYNNPTYRARSFSK